MSDRISRVVQPVHRSDPGWITVGRVASQCDRQGDAEAAEVVADVRPARVPAIELPAATEQGPDNRGKRGVGVEPVRDELSTRLIVQIAAEALEF